jgi:membrane fusion protein, multidrug efflux system
MNEVVDRGTQASPGARKKRIVVRLLLLAMAVAVCTFVVGRRGRADAKPAPAPAPVPVVVGPVERRDLPIWLSGVGSVQPLNVVDVKVRVDGQLERVAFTEGQEVHAGELLAQIDPRPYQAQLMQAEANLARDEAQLANARLDFGRFTRLASMGASPGQNADTLRAQVAALEATVKADHALIDTARLQREFTNVTSPLNGRVGLRQVHPGAIVHAADPSGLVTVTQLEPISVLFSLPQDDLPDILAASAQGKPTVTVRTGDGTRDLAQGELLFVDSQVDPTNGQVRLRASFANGGRTLWPGEFVTARLLLRTDRNAAVVPARAVQRSQDGTFVYALKPDQTVEVRPVKTGPTVDGFTALLAGVTPGELVVFDGQSRLVSGAKVTAKQATPATATVELGVSR